MGANFTKSQDLEREDNLSTEWKRVKPILLFHETFSDDSSDAISTPSCRSVDGNADLIVRNVQESPALQELEESVMQARAAEDYRQARRNKSRRGSVVSDLSQPMLTAKKGSQADSWDLPSVKKSLGWEDLTEGQPQTKAGKTDPDRVSVTSDESSFGSLGSSKGSKGWKGRKASKSDGKNPKKR